MSIRESSAGFIWFLCAAIWENARKLIKFTSKSWLMTESVDILPEGAPKPENALASVVSGMEVYMELKGLIDTVKENARLMKEQETVKKEIDSSPKNWGTRNFLKRRRPMWWRRKRPNWRCRKKR